MNEAKFTKGPWKVAGSASPNTLIVATEDGPIHGRVAIVENRAGNCKANAYLIAAATEQHRALSDAYVQLLKYFGPERSTSEYQLLLGSCRDAIAKALDEDCEAVQVYHEAKARGES